MPVSTQELTERAIDKQPLSCTARLSRHCAVLTLLICSSALNAVWGATALNARSPVGVNLQQVSYYTSEQPFLDVFKTAGGWTTHTDTTWDTKEERYLNLDPSGWPISLTVVNTSTPQIFTSVGILLFRDMPDTENGFYPAGQYVVLYDGQGRMTYGGDARLVASSSGRDLINVQKPSGGGIDIRLVATNPKNHLRNVRVVKLEFENALKAGKIFNPKFLEIIQNFRALRFMEWFRTNESSESSWGRRPLVSDAFWGTSKGVPIEVAIQLANAISADAWLNIPVAADDDYISQMAMLVKSHLGPTQRAYVELSNEVWNGIYPASGYSIKQGTAAFPTAPNKYYAGWEWYGMRVAQIADIWYGVFGDGFSSRVSVVMSGQGGNAAVLGEELSTPDWTGAGHGPAAAHHVAAAAIAPYFGGMPAPECFQAWLAQSDGGLSSFFQSLYVQNDPSVPVGGYIESVAASIKVNLKIAAQYKIPLLAYEGGQSFQGFPKYLNGSPVVDFLIAANRDTRMAAAYTAYLGEWKANGGGLFMHFVDTYPPSQYGEWGALESTMQTVSPLSNAPSKWQALQNFILNQPCWWVGCAAAAY